MFNFVKSYVRSDQGGSRNLFSEHKYENANTFLNVTLVSDDNKPSSAHKGSNYQKHNAKWIKTKQNPCRAQHLVCVIFCKYLMCE